MEKLELTQAIMPSCWLFPWKEEVLWHSLQAPIYSFVCMCMCICVSQRTTWDSFYHLGPGVWTQAIRFEDRCVYVQLFHHPYSQISKEDTWVNVETLFCEQIKNKKRGGHRIVGVARGEGVWSRCGIQWNEYHLGMKMSRGQKIELWN